ncbi:MAG: DUF5996 family protein [Bacteroidota bacterium]
MPDPWPRLPSADAWADTRATVHRWTQIVGKVRIAHTPLVNHWWNAPLYVSARGLTTSAMAVGARRVEIAFDFVDHRLGVTTSDGDARTLALGPIAVADVYAWLMEALADLGLETEIWPMPVEIPGDVQLLSEDRDHAAYDPEAVHAYWRALAHVDRVLATFRAGFLGKASPVHFFWGAFDHAVTRFSGRTAPPHPGGAPKLADGVMHEAYSHEVSSAGFWPGPEIGEAAFYSYAYPEPAGFAAADVRPEAARYEAALGEFVLPYEAVRTAPAPEAALLDFLETTYAAAADLGAWDRAALERP